MRVVLVDDDATVRDNMKTLLSIYAKDCIVIAEANGVKSGIKCLQENKPDLLLLDVEMQDGTGFDLLSIYGKLDFKVVFVTGHDAYAIKAFKYSAIDYILKPVDPEELKSAIEKAKNSSNIEEQNLAVSNLVENKEKADLDKKIVLKDTETVYLVSTRDIIRCESEANYTKFYLGDGRKLTISKTLKEYDKLFEDQSFFRAHQSHLINLLHFDRYEKREGGMIIMKNGSTVPLAVRKKDALMQALDRIG
jgi:two-component system, LytTR family, response regulator